MPDDSHQTLLPKMRLVWTHSWVRWIKNSTLHICSHFGQGLVQATQTKESSQDTHNRHGACVCRVVYAITRKVRMHRAPMNDCTTFTTWFALVGVRCPLLSGRMSNATNSITILIAVCGGIAANQSPAMHLWSSYCTGRNREQAHVTSASFTSTHRVNHFGVGGAVSHLPRYTGVRCDDT